MTSVVDPACTGKIPYDTHAAALFRIKKQEQRGFRRNSRQMGMVAYACERCGFWHVGGSKARLR